MYNRHQNDRLYETFSVIRKEENKEVLTVIIMIMSQHIE